MSGRHVHETWAWLASRWGSWTPNRERKISPKFFRPKFFHGRSSGMSVRKCLFFQDMDSLTEVFGRMSAGISGAKLHLWAEFSFLTKKPKRGHKNRSQKRGYTKWNNSCCTFKTGTRIHLPKLRFYKTTLLFPLNL